MADTNDWYKDYPADLHRWLERHGYDETIDPRMAKYNAELAKVGKGLSEVASCFAADSSDRAYAEHQAQCLKPLFNKWKWLIEDHKAQFGPERGLPFVDR